MYQPRRTSEFHDDARDDGAILNKRQSRAQRSTSASVNKPSHSNWQAQSRLTQDRDRGTPLRSGPLPTTKRSVANGTTPLRHRQATSVERPVALHTDKKWVQEQSQLIAEYLDEMNHLAILPGFPNEFFSRGGTALRQMTMKQFVSIVNFFFQFIWGNRTSVGNNHVDDITSVLHKINYPYQVNKSWLMTPTTQHSFGHVIVMLDFLKDFAPVLPLKQQEAGEDEEFPFVETSEQPSYVQNTLDSMALSNTQISSIMLNEETVQLLFTSTKDCFAMWDKKKGDDFPVLEREVRNQIIKSLCDFPDIESLDEDIIRLQNELQQLEEQLQLPSENNMEQLEQLIAQEQHLEKQLLIAQTRGKEYSEKIAQLFDRNKQHVKEMKVLHREWKQLQCEVSGQKYTVEQFQRMKLMLSDLENEEHFYKRQTLEFTERGYDQQVRMARAKKHLLDQVEKFNTHAQNIVFDSNICSASEKDKLELLLPLPPLHSDIQVRSRRLTKLAALLEKRGAQHRERHRQLEQHRNELTLQNRNLQTELNNINKQVQSYEKKVLQLHHAYKTKRAMWAQHQEQLEERSLELNAKFEQLKRHQEELTLDLENKRQQNEDYLSAAERRQEERLRERSEFLENYQQKLAVANEQLKQFEAIVTQNNVELANLERKLESIKLSPFENELNAAFLRLKESK
ncbi:early endosome antigen 1 [Drosophila grimshawi]|uniref:Kinetochore protein NDC80 n=1 Tax=Drosophila grimshawi TaxID=7222 RepID=B4JJJ5_DROGR|nr:early endosome antigen 1 [Drosophila grimshawi]EDV99747.1 GH12244 [Drosophila grimshawi]